jgi:hypothetical protein
MLLLLAGICYTLGYVVGGLVGSVVVIGVMVER